MVRYERYVYEPEIIAAILELCPVVHIGFQDRDNAYVVPMNYGYTAGDKLRIYVHTAKEGYKLRLIERNPVVCCSFAAWRNFPDHPYKDSVHDFRSVMAFGEMRRLDPAAEPQACREAMQALFRHTGRTRCLNPKGVQAIHLFVIQCDWADVSGKTESPVRRPEDVPFPDVRNLPPDDTPYDDSDLCLLREDRIRNRRHLGFLEEGE